MHALKSSSPKNIQENISNLVKKSPLKATVSSNKTSGMVTENPKAKMTTSSSSSKSQNDVNALSLLEKSKTSCLTTNNTNSPKRKDGESDHLAEKKVKADNNTLKLQLSESTSKKSNKSVYPKTYICKFCCRRFISEEHLQQHTKSHGNKTSHICYLCNHQTASFSALMTHYLKHSGNKADKLNKIYAKSKADFSNIQFNLSSCSKSSFRCTKCKLSFNTKLKFDSHNCVAELLKGEYNCAYCGHVSHSVEEYRNHILSHSETPFKCSNCKYKAPTKKLLDKHKDQCKKLSKFSSVFKCDKCKFQCKKKGELEEHLKLCENDNNKDNNHIKDNIKYTCEKCGTEFCYKKSYYNHISNCNSIRKTKRKKKLKKENVDNTFSCSVCESTFILKSEYEEHEKLCVTKTSTTANEKTSDYDSLVENSKIAEHSEKSADENESTIEQAKTAIHIETHSNQKEVNVEEKSISSVKRKGCLNKNKIIVRKKSAKNVVKKVCSVKNEPQEVITNTNDSHVTRRSSRLVRRKTFDDDNEVVKKTKILKIKISKNQSTILKTKFRSRQTKSKNSSFICNICDFSFCSKSTLLRHKRMHSGNPWYTCQYCGKFFFRKDVYLRHEMNVHGKSTKVIFCCCYCKLCFKEPASLKDHVLVDHKDAAFLPSSTKRISTKVYTLNKSTVKQEFESKTWDSDLSGSNETLNKTALSETFSSFSTVSYKCSVCSEGFKNSSDIEVHMLSHPDKSQIENKISNISRTKEKEHLPIKNDSLKCGKTKTFDAKLDNSDSLCKSNISIHDSTKFTAHINTGSDFEDNLETSALSNSFSYSDKNQPDTNITTPNDIRNLKCLLCFKEFSEKILLEEHNKTMHKVVDWYQCLVCSTSGPRQDMVDHMFSHMFKVGTFVVNSNNRNFDSIMSCLTEKDNQKEMHNKPSDNCKQTDMQQLGTCSSETIDLIIDEELPPLREFGLCPCVTNKSEQEKDIMPALEKVDDLEINFSETYEEAKENSNLCIGTNDDADMNLNEAEAVVKCSENNLISLDEDIDDISVNTKTTICSADNNIILMPTDIDDEIKMNLDISESNDVKCSEYNNTINIATDINDDIIDDCNISSVTAVQCSDDDSIAEDADVCCKSVAVLEAKDESMKEQSQSLSELSFSSQVKNEHNLSFQSDGSVGDNQSFSQLRYLLQKPSKVKLLKNKVTPYTEMSSFNFDSSSSFLKCASNIEEANALLPHQQDQNTDAINLTSKEKHSFDLLKQNSSSFNSEIYFSAPVSSDANQSTCLKFDVNQSRGEFSENPATSNFNSKLQNCELDKTENFFKPCPTQSTILDFSDLIQHSFESSSTYEDNLFSYSTPTKQVDLLDGVCSREEVQTPDCSDIVNYDCSTLSNPIKCEYCNEELDEKSNHKCVYNKIADKADINSLYESKNTFPSLDYNESHNQISNIVNTSEQKLNFLPPSNSSETYIYAKVTSSETELDRYQKSQPVQIVGNPPHHNTKCNRCQGTFGDIGELMKHSLDCLKSLFFKSPHTNDCITSPSALHTLLLKDEPKPNFASFPSNSSVPYSNVAMELSHTNSDDFKHPFDS